jgi:hypothetical protein
MKFVALSAEAADEGLRRLPGCDFMNGIKMRASSLGPSTCAHLTEGGALTSFHQVWEISAWRDNQLVSRVSRAAFKIVVGRFLC